jgi:hypothetical protein
MEIFWQSLMGHRPTYKIRGKVPDNQSLTWNLEPGTFGEEETPCHNTNPKKSP